MFLFLRLHFDEGEAFRGRRVCSRAGDDQREDLPFHKTWVKAGVDWKKYQSLYIENVNTQYMLDANWWQQSMREDEMEADVREVAGYMKQAFEEAFRNDPLNRFQVVESPAEGSLVLEMALTELVPSHPVMEALSMAAPYGSGVVVQAAAKESGAKATVAFEAKIKDARTGEVLAMAADREQGEGCTHQPEGPHLVQGGRRYHR